MSSAPEGYASGRAPRAWVRALTILSVACLLIAGCDGAFFFGAVDAAAGNDADASPDGAADSNLPDVGGSACALSCAPGGTCAISAGPGCAVTCKNATCQIDLGEEGKAICSDGARCTIVCGEECSVTCLDTSQCPTRCATGSTLTTPAATTLVCGSDN